MRFTNGRNKISVANVSELREVLEGLPDETPLFSQDSSASHVFNTSEYELSITKPGVSRTERLKIDPIFRGND